MKPLTAAALITTFPLIAMAHLKTELIDYKQGDTVLQGYFAYDDAMPGKRPGILVVHEWDGLGPYVKTRCDQLAKFGYAAFAADIYGKGVRPETPKECAAEAGKYKSDNQLFRARVNAGLDELKKQEQVDPARVAAIGYCFGGSAVLELARSGADVAGVVSFHGGLGTPQPAAPGSIKCAVLVLTGADDPHAPPGDVTAFEDEMRKAGVDWQMVIYGNAVHGFTNPARGTDNSKGVAYNAKADERSWKAMFLFFDELFKPGKAK